MQSKIGHNTGVASQMSGLYREVRLVLCFETSINAYCKRIYFHGFFQVSIFARINFRGFTKMITVIKCLLLTSWVLLLALLKPTAKIAKIRTLRKLIRLHCSKFLKSVKSQIQHNSHIKKYIHRPVVIFYLFL